LGETDTKSKAKVCTYILACSFRHIFNKIILFQIFSFIEQEIDQYRTELFDVQQKFQQLTAKNEKLQTENDHLRKELNELSQSLSKHELNTTKSQMEMNDLKRADAEWKYAK
jgi:regulator of replication initiation timing